MKRRVSSLDMLPSFGCSNEPDGVSAQAIFFGDGCKFSGLKIICAHLLGRLFGYLRERADLWTSDSSPSVLRVFAQSEIFKVFKPIVIAYAVFVVHLMTIWARPDKRSQNFAMNFRRFFPDGCVAQPDKHVPIFVRALLPDDVNRLASALDAPKRADLVVGPPADNWRPDFFHFQSPLIESLRKKVHGNRYGKRLSGATLAMRGGFYHA